MADAREAFLERVREANRYADAHGWGYHGDR